MPFWRRSRTRPTAIAPAAAEAAARAGELVLVDVRDARERAQGRPPRSLHVPLGELGDRLDELPTDRTVAFVCQSGMRSAAAARRAARSGRRAANVRGGLVAWSRAGLPLERGPERSRRARP